MSDINMEMAKLYLEASELIIKLSNFIKINELPNSKIYLEAANSFISKNSFYKTAVNGFVAPEKQFSNTYKATPIKPMPETFSYKSNTPEPPKIPFKKQADNNDDDLY